MGDFADIAVGILTSAERRLEVSGHNISNMTTPGYKSRISFETLLNSDQTGGADSSNSQIVRDFSVGNLMNTGNPSDLALTGPGFFVVRAPDGVLYTRTGTFHRDGEGRLVTSRDWPVQAQGGGDIVLKTNTFKVGDDGVVTEDGEPVAKLAIMDFAGAKTFTDAEDGYLTMPEDGMRGVATPGVRQGALEASNVSTADEMVAMMEALRRAEAGQRLVNVYDDLMGRVLSTFGQA